MAYFFVGVGIEFGQKTSILHVVGNMNEGFLYFWGRPENRLIFVLFPVNTPVMQLQQGKVGLVLTSAKVHHELFWWAQPTLQIL